MIAYDDLKRSLATGNVCAFVGAGLSAGAGLPGWYDLIAELSARIGYELPPAKWATGDALIDAAQAYVNRQGLHALISHLKDRLDTTGVQPTAAHRALARLPISLVFTANFDDLLERAFRDAGKRVEVVVQRQLHPLHAPRAGHGQHRQALRRPGPAGHHRAGAAAIRIVLPPAAADGQAAGDRTGAFRHAVPGLERQRSLFQAGLRRAVEPFRADDAAGLCGHVRRDRRATGRAGAQADPAGGVAGWRSHGGSWPRGWRAWRLVCADLSHRCRRRQTWTAVCGDPSRPCPYMEHGRPPRSAERGFQRRGADHPLLRSLSARSTKTSPSG